PEQRLLVVVVVVQQALVDACAFGDALDTRATEAVGCELVARCAKNGFARPFSVTRPGFEGVFVHRASGSWRRVEVSAREADVAGDAARAHLSRGLVS